MRDSWENLPSCQPGGAHTPGTPFCNLCPPQIDDFRPRFSPPVCSPRVVFKRSWGNTCTNTERIRHGGGLGSACDSGYIYIYIYIYIYAAPPRARGAGGVEICLCVLAGSLEARRDMSLLHICRSRQDSLCVCRWWPTLYITNTQQRREHSE